MSLTKFYTNNYNQTTTDQHDWFNRGHFLLVPSHAPFLMSVSLFNLTLGVVMMIKGVGTWLMVVTVPIPFWYCTWMMVRHGSYIGIVSMPTQVRYLTSFYWLIAAESFAFLSLLMSWVLKGTWLVSMGLYKTTPAVDLPSALGLGLMNSALLLSSSVTLTQAHMSVLVGNFPDAKKGLLLTIVLGMIFLGVQWTEFTMSYFCMSDGFWGSMLYACLGFHGLHVLVGVLFLLYALIQMCAGYLASDHHALFNCAAIYWHFVDVVWVFVFLSFYLML
uniref:Cytochrome c oxidase subunit 3 n=1 Tax=Ihlea magalhanica TaxID=2781116 RepID=A0AA86IMG8_9UROC|nr:cytochrome c oxidase subunit III [Ihlea magalhanica]